MGRVRLLTTPQVWRSHHVVVTPPAPHVVGVRPRVHVAPRPAWGRAPMHGHVVWAGHGWGRQSQHAQVGLDVRRATHAHHLHVVQWRHPGGATGTKAVQLHLTLHLCEHLLALSDSLLLEGAVTLVHRTKLVASPSHSV